MGLYSASIDILVNDSTHFVRPSVSPDVPTNDPLLNGVVVLELPKPKRLKGLFVKLVRHTNICFPDYAYEFGQSVEAEVSIQASEESSKEERVYDKGKHSFAFTLILPSSIAPYERSQYGRVFYKLVATAKEMDSWVQMWWEKKTFISWRIPHRACFPQNTVAILIEQISASTRRSSDYFHLFLSI